MRAVLALLLLLGGCAQDFDDQYAETEKKVKAAEAKLDADMAKEAAKEPGDRRNNK
jgi:PBP1b-binding outer membrane lipoprotein LpoB